ncbi:hypothetical protein CCO03_08565 [Comamonas serinivorans]|uniref:Uncharacterized protein n=1 Tax=Comamonas serinivorans TaxID=1082851 RepID=A0A1Y0EN32_9BURK|nr:hypothetical protein [Comamonas serinivorans]ARU04719.1 hypothetical protein CCO03_08565 [Comamonas serinivorans]
MDAKTLFDQMCEPRANVDQVRNITATYADLVAGIADRLTPAELDAFIRLGSVMKGRVTVKVPLLKLEQVDAWLAYSKKHFPSDAAALRG